MAIAKDFKNAVGGRRVIAYNAPWAADVLAAESARHGVENPVPGLGLDDCVMAQRSRYAAYFRSSDHEYQKLKLGSLDRTPMGVAATVCDVVQDYASGRAKYYDLPYDPDGGRSRKERDHEFGWRDAEKAEHDRKEAERKARREREEQEAIERKKRKRAEELRAEGKGEEEIAATLEAEADVLNTLDFEDIWF